MGAEVTAIDIADEEELALATFLGAVSALNAGASDVVRELRKQGGVHVALVTSAAKAAYDTAFRCLRAERVLLLVVGLPAENICFPPIMMAAGEVRIRASAVGTRQDLRAVLALAELGKVRCRIHDPSLARGQPRAGGLGTWPGHRPGCAHHPPTRRLDGPVAGTIGGNEFLEGGRREHKPPFDVGDGVYPAQHCQLASHAHALRWCKRLCSAAVYQAVP